MRALSAAEFLDVWEHGARSPAQRAPLPLPRLQKHPSRLTQFSIGQRDAGLLALREQTLGRNAVLRSVSMRGQLNFTSVRRYSRDFFESKLAAPLYLTHADYHVEFRLPTSLDLASLDQQQTSRRSTAFAQRCVVAAQRGGHGNRSGGIAGGSGGSDCTAWLRPIPRRCQRAHLSKCQHAWKRRSISFRILD